MKDQLTLSELSARERREFCRRVIEALSELVEGTASPELTAQVETLLSRQTGYRALCQTLADTIGLAAECGECSERLVDEPSFQRAVERVRQRLKDES